MTTFNIFHTTRVRIGVRDAPHIWGAGEIRDAGERRLFGGLARSEPFVKPHVWGTGEMSTEISATYLGRCGNKHWKSRSIYVALGHDELIDLCGTISGPGRCGNSVKVQFFELFKQNGSIDTAYKSALSWMLQFLIDDKSTLLQLMAWCCQATSHYLNQNQIQPIEAKTKWPPVRR